LELRLLASNLWVPHLLIHELLNNLHTGKQTDLIILDFSKAFDKVPHKKLLRKFDNYGIRGNIWNWISICRVTHSLWFSIVRYQIQSSANKRVLDETDAGTSLMNTKKSSVPRIYPWGTPLTTSIWLETSPPRTTRCCLL
jgi:hypothetical protein